MRRGHLIKNIFKLLFVVWLVLWVVFIIREDKDGQYAFLKNLYGTKPENRMRYAVGNDMYDFWEFCKEKIPENSTYEILGFEKYSIDEVRGEYLLWPLRSGDGMTDFKLIYGNPSYEAPGYESYSHYKDKGKLLINKELL